MGNVDNLKIKLQEFRQKLNALKDRNKLNNHKTYYGYDILSNIIHISPILENNLNILVDSHSIADIGCADGDLSFFLEYLFPDKEYICVDHSNYNWNNMNGIKELKSKLLSKVTTAEKDIDEEEPLDKQVDLTILLGLFYHIKNPIRLMQKLNNKSKYVLFSTRITNYTPDLKHNISGYSLAYFATSTEINNDPTNWWIFTESCLEKIFERTNWNIVAKQIVGETKKSTPDDPHRDCRYFCLLKNKK